MFFKGSRYAQVPSAQHRLADGRLVSYKKLRLLPTPPPVTRHIVAQDERLDQIAHQHFRDPQRYWRICDANVILWPDTLVAQAGREILISSAGD